MKALSLLKGVAGNQVVVRTTIYIAGFGAGFATAKYLVGKQERARYETLLDEAVKKEVEKTKAFYKVLSKREEYSTPPAPPEYKTEVKRYSLSHNRPEPKAEEKPEPEPEAEEAIEEDPPYPKTDEERTARLREKYDKGEAFMVWDTTLAWSIRIDQEEFLKNVFGFDQVSWTYFSEDDVMADEHNQYITDWKTMIDSDLVEVLDSASVAEDVLFVRNKDRKTEYMITLDAGSYSSTLGVDDHIQHEYGYRRGPKVKKFRSEDG